MVIMGIIAIISTFNYFMANSLIKVQKQTIDELYKQDTTVLIFALSRIMKESSEKEDYETANKCFQYIKELEKK
jgi:DNA-binding ferritin-like protein